MKVSIALKSFSFYCALIFFTTLLTTACVDAQQQFCKQNRDCPRTHYCAKSGGVLFTANHCVTKHSSTPTSTSCSAHTSCATPTPFCNKATEQCVACLNDSDCPAEFGTNFQGVCSEHHTCGFDSNLCAENFVDLDQNPENGCEYEINVPSDCLGTNSNCDGVVGIWDGPHANVVFLSADGNDGIHSGLHPDTPLASFSRALEVAAQKKRTYVLVTDGDFQEQLILKDGIHIYGGYAPDNFSKRDLSKYKTRILGLRMPEPEQSHKTVIASGLTKQTILDGLTITGRNTLAGESTYAIWAYHTNTLILQNTSVLAGNGGDGTAGEDVSGIISPCIAPPGGDGGKSHSYAPCFHGGSNTPGNDGSLATDEYGKGGRGGRNFCVDDINMPSATADNGHNGSHGKPGDSGENGKPSQEFGAFNAQGLWIAPEASHQPEAGTPGGGGGGGGAGGSIEKEDVSPSKFAFGGDGGSGGNGGCGGENATNGLPGGSSFGIVSISSKVVIRDSNIAPGRAGNGGDGGRGAFGAQGAPYQLGQPGQSDGDYYGGEGGHGGNGGNGGEGGHGAGGNGGHSIGIATAYGGLVNTDNNVSFLMENSLGGLGGRSGSTAIAPASQGFSFESYEQAINNP